MTPFQLTAFPKSDESSPSLRINTRSGKHLATIWADSTITFNPEIDFEVEELKAILELEKNFFTLYNSIFEKDEEIRELKLSLNPIIERQ